MRRSLTALTRDGNIWYGPVDLPTGTLGAIRFFLNGPSA